MKGSGQQSSKEIIPTKSEMDVLQILWSQGPATVRLVHDTLNEQKDAVQYTSTLKLMQVMTEKGMLERDETNMKHVYTALLEEKKTKGFILDRLVDTLYGGSVSNLMIALLGNDKTSKKELEKLKAIVKNMGDSK